MSPLSSSDHSDIVTLRDLKEDEHVEAGEEAATNEEFYLGTSCSSQYAFTAAETGRPASTETHTDTLNCHHVFFDQHINTKTFFLCLFCWRRSRFDVESLETSTETPEFRLPPEESSHWRPLFPRWPD